MKHQYLSLLAGGALLALSACSADEPLVSTNGDGNVSFTVSLPGGMNTRAEGDEQLAKFATGTTATALEYHIYEIDGDNLNYIVSGEKTMSGLKATVDMNLVNGKSYGIVWFAQAPKDADGNQLYSYDKTNHTITVDYAVKHNVEERDAFYKYTEIKNVQGAINENVILTRPFAQVNFGTSDIDPTHAVNYPILENAFGDDLANLKTMLVTADVPSKLDLVTGETSTPVAVNFIPTAIAEGYEFPYKSETDTYSYLAMNYILAPATGAVLNLDFSILTADDNATVENPGTVYNTITVANAPVKANYRTNIFGQLITSSADFTVVIEPEPMTPDAANIQYVADGVKYIDNTYVISSKEGLLWFKDEANKKKNSFYGQTIKLGADIDMEGIEWEGLYNYPYQYTTWFRGTFDGDNHTISNLSVKNEETEAGFFCHAESYSVIKNLNMKNVSVTGHMSAGAIVGMIYTGRIENCTVDGGTIISTPHLVDGKMDDGNNVGGILGHMSAQPQSAAEREQSLTGVVNCKVSNVYIIGYRCIGAIAGTLTNNSSRFEGDPVNTNNTAENCTVTANMTVSNYDGAPRQPQAEQLFGRFAGDAKLGTGNVATNVNVNVITETSFPENVEGVYQVAEKTYAVTTSEGLKNYFAIINGTYSPATRAAAIDFGSVTCELTSDVDLEGENWEPAGIFRGVFNGNGHTIKNLYVKGVSKLGFVGELRGTIKNVNFDGAKIVGNHYLGVVAGYTTDHCSAFVENVTVKNAEIINSPELLANGSYDNGDKAGVIYGYLANDNLGITNCHVENSTVSGYRDLGGIAGLCDSKVDGCSVNGLTINQINFSLLDDPKTEENANCKAIVGRTNNNFVNVTENNTFSNVTINYDVAE